MWCYGRSSSNPSITKVVKATTVKELFTPSIASEKSYKPDGKGGGVSGHKMSLKETNALAN